MPPALEPRGVAITMETIALYAEMTEDFNPIHMDPEFARNTPMREVIAHGTLSLNLIWESLEATLGAAKVEELTVRFVRPARIGDVLSSGGQRLDDGSLEVWVKNQAGETVIVGSAVARTGDVS